MKTIIIDGIEYNLTPKVLFKKGDFVVIQETTYLISKIEGLNVTLSCNGRDCLFDIDVLKSARLWDITKDAKDGDVLLFEGNYNSIVLFHGIGINGKGRINYHCKCDLGNYSFGVQGNTAYLGTIEENAEHYHPATKEQRDLLFQKMKEAGYEWDAEKKELKKIEQKPTDEEMKETLRTEYEKGRADVIAEMQKLVWSEEDTEISSMLIELVESKEESMEVKVEFITWIRSLKNKILPKPKQGWSEEDAKMLEGIIECGEHHLYLDLEDVNWIKSIKDRYTWKPSKEQMKALEDAIEFLGCTKKVRNDLKSLYEQLKKLREG